MPSRESRSVFWEDLAADLKDPIFRDNYVRATDEIAATDRAANGHAVAEVDADWPPQ